MKNNWKWVLLGSLLVGGILSLFASSSPDGLEKVAETKGFLGQGRQLFVAIIPDYSLPGVESEILATSLAGIIGTSVVCMLLFFVGKGLYGFGSREEKTR